MEDKIKAIDTLKTVLGTMVIFPIETFDLENVGQKKITGSVQRPILEGENRTKVERKLLELIDSIDINTL